MLIPTVSCIDEDITALANKVDVSYHRITVSPYHEVGLGYEKIVI